MSAKNFAIEKNSSLSDAQDREEAIEIHGTIKWFDIGKGYGFIVANNSQLPDILLHVDTLRRDGFLAVPIGASVLAWAIKTKRGYQCSRVEKIDLSTAVHPSEIPPATHKIVSSESKLETASVKWFNYKKGFGFLTRAETQEDIFIHMETLRRYGFTELRPGQKILVRFGFSDKGAMASEVYPEQDSSFPIH